MNINVQGYVRQTTFDESRKMENNNSCNSIDSSKHCLNTKNNINDDYG